MGETRENVPRGWEGSVLEAIVNRPRREAFTGQDGEGC